MEHFQGTYDEDEIDGPLSKHICKVFGRYKDVHTNKLSQVLPPTKELDYKTKVTLGSEPPSKTP